MFRTSVNSNGAMQGAKNNYIMRALNRHNAIYINNRPTRAMHRSKGNNIYCVLMLFYSYM